MRDEYDFSKAVRNPSFAERMKKGYTIVIEGDDYDEIIEVRKTIKHHKDKKEKTTQEEC
ncbi:MAG: hypothetical protein FWC67_00775 [Defluviitaleaceae bacterium]|nr:hypothetical protein [Defluviitaleaceae bacterium]